MVIYVVAYFSGKVVYEHCLGSMICHGEFLREFLLVSVYAPRCLTVYMYRDLDEATDV